MHRIWNALAFGKNFHGYGLWVSVHKIPKLNSMIVFSVRACVCVCIFYVNNLLRTFSLSFCVTWGIEICISRIELNSSLVFWQLIVPVSVQTYQISSILLFFFLTFSRNSFWLFEIRLFHFHRGVAFSFTKNSQPIQLQRTNKKYTFPKRRLHKVERKNSFF